MNMTTLKCGRKLTALALITTMSGCATPAHQAIVADTGAATAVTDRVYAKSQAPVAASSVMDSSGFWVNKRSIKTRDDTDSLPAAFRTNVDISYNPKGSLKDIVTILTKATGLRYSVAPDLQQEIAAPLLHNNFKSNMPLKQLLDQMTAQENISWRFNEGSVEFFRYDTKFFRVSAIPGQSQEFSAKLSNKSSTGAATGSGAGGSNGGATSSTGQDMTITNKFNFWKNVGDEVKQMLSTNGRYSVSETNSMITVTDTPQVLHSVEAYVNAMNEAKTKQVMISVEIYSVDTNNTEDYAVSWNAAFQNLSRKYGVSLTAPLSNATTALGKLTAIIQPDSTSPWAGTEAILGALSSVGNTTLMTSASQMTMSGISAPTNITREITYLASVSSTTSTTTGVQTALTPGVVSVGFSMNSTPLVLDGDNLILQEAIDISALDKLDSFGNGSNSIQTPQKSSQSFVNQFKMRSGQTLMMTGYQQTENGFANSGVGHADAMILGGGKKSAAKRRTLVILVTPTIVSSK